jgi:GNAT superfamily N-acetyltransferase
MTEIMRHDLGSDGTVISIRTDTGEVAGSVTVTQIGHRCKIGLLQVRPSFRGHNFGPVLLKESESWAREHQYPEIYLKLIPVPGNTEAMLNLLTDHGYSINLKTGIARKKIS